MLTKNDGPQWHGPTLVNDPAVELVERHPHSLAARHFCCRTNGSLPAGVQFESGPTDGTPSCSYFWWGYTHKCALIPHIHIIIYLCIHMCIHIYIYEYHVYIWICIIIIHLYWSSICVDEVPTLGFLSNVSYFVSVNQDEYPKEDSNTLKNIRYHFCCWIPVFVFQTNSSA